MARIEAVALAMGLPAGAGVATGLNGQLLAALGTACIDNGTATTRFHADAKTVGTLAAGN